MSVTKEIYQKDLTINNRGYEDIMKKFLSIMTILFLFCLFLTGFYNNKIGGSLWPYIKTASMEKNNSANMQDSDGAVRNSYLQSTNNQLLVSNTPKKFMKSYIEENGNTNDSLATLAVIFYTNGYRDYAKKVVEEILGDNPIHIEALQILAMLYEQSGDIENYIARYKETMRRFPDNIELLNNLANFYMNRSDLLMRLPLLKNR